MSTITNGRPTDGIKVKKNNAHTCNSREISENSAPENQPLNIPIEQLPILKPNNNVVKEMIRLEPLKGKQYFFEKSLAQNIKISKSKIKDYLTEIREELYPTNTEAALSDEFCKTKDNNCCQAFNQYQGTIKIPKSGGKLETVTKSFIIFASKFMLKLLEEPVWFIDATFSIVPTSFYQLLTIIVYHTSTRTYAPAAFILMNGKHERLYGAVFSSLVSVCKGYNIHLKPLKVMSDFELALRNAIQEVFPSVELMGCFFHYCQCLWMHASKLGLRAPSRIQTTKKLLVLLKVLPHLEQKDREEIFAEIKIIYKPKEKPFQEFISYYQKYWLDYSIKFEEFESEDRFVRTNNVCEQYNRRLKQKIQMKHPRIAILITALLEEEDIFKRKIVGSLSQIPCPVFLNHCSVSKEEALPFSYLTGIILEKKKFKHNLRSSLAENDFIDSLMNLCEKCQDFVFPQLANQDNRENQNNEINQDSQDNQAQESDENNQSKRSS